MESMQKHASVGLSIKLPLTPKFHSQMTRNNKLNLLRGMPSIVGRQFAQAEGDRGDLCSEALVQCNVVQAVNVIPPREGAKV